MSRPTWSSLLGGSLQRFVCQTSGPQIRSFGLHLHEVLDAAQSWYDLPPYLSHRDDAYKYCSLFILTKPYFSFESADVRGLVNKKHVQEGHDQVQQALLDYTLTCYPSVAVCVINE